MNARMASSHVRYYVQRRSSRIAFGVALLLALLSGVLLFSNGISGGLIATIITIGLDPLRAQLIAAYVLTTGTAFAGASLGRHRGGAFLGAEIVFYFGYLAGFIQLQVQPVYDPGGRLELLNYGALLYTVLIMLALASLTAFVGAAVGRTMRDLVLDPPLRSLRSVWRHFRRDREERVPSTNDATIPSSPRGARTNVIRSWFCLGLMVVCLVLASRSADLFLFSPDVGVHIVPNGISAYGTVIRQRMVSPALGGRSRSFLVYLPPSYTLPWAASRRYPTLYLLHGTPGHMTDWIIGGKADQSVDLLIARGQIPELILILPDGNGRPGATSEWGNSFDQQQRIESFVALDLVAYVDRHYRTLADAAYRGIGGLSMGGFGATNIAVHHPDVFGTVISLGGYYRAEGAIWGKNATYRRANSPIDVLPRNQQAWKLHIYLGAATQDRPYYEYTKEFMRELDALHLPYRFDLHPGYHSWRVWQVQMYQALAWIPWGRESLLKQDATFS